VAAGERPPSSVGEETRSAPLSATDPRHKLRDTVSADRPQLNAARVGRAETSRGDSGLNCDLTTRLRLETRCELARYLKAGTDYLSPLAVRRIIQVADEDVVGSLTAVCRLDREVHELSATHPGGDPIEQMESVNQMYEEEILEWERTKTVRPGSVMDVDPDLMQEPTGQKLVEVLEKILAEDKAAECPPLRLADTKWTRQALRQATKVSCMAEEICDTTPKAGWQPCAYSIYRWRLEQEVRHLYACFGGPDEEEAVAKAQKKAKTWLTKAHEGIEWARDHIGLHLSEVVKTGEIQRHIAVPGLELGHLCRHHGPPGESRPSAVQAEAAIQRACRAWEANLGRLQSVCGEIFEVADQSVWDKALAARGDSGMKWAPEAASEFPPDLTSSEEDSESSTTDMSPATGAAVHGGAAQDEERPDAQCQDPHDQGARLAPRPYPRDQGSRPREQRTGTNLVSGWDRVDHEQAGHHQGIEAAGPGRAVSSHAGEAGHAGRWLGQRGGASG
jgi:hypothetical protein